ncbi:TPR repeat-containing protein [Desulfacinum infernum DSM 9756]|uniref:TPR repeat-containing protein n=1 Tax=Desulfacinum infernum DSM 9756 TaxID=1121391 RepID=A0A1M5HA85_9BACT|nr:tetratricopeptide repeat protein [Desulfacinum infernum]SHG12672.1 TPR repeat-containing protein [Desulfacinum infernum DSM 9756]
METASSPRLSFRWDPSQALYPAAGFLLGTAAGGGAWTTQAHGLAVALWFASLPWLLFALWILHAPYAVISGDWLAFGPFPLFVRTFRRRDVCAVHAAGPCHLILELRSGGRYTIPLMPLPGEQRLLLSAVLKRWAGGTFPSTGDTESGNGLPAALDQVEDLLRRGKDEEAGKLLEEVVRKHQAVEPRLFLLRGFLDSRRGAFVQAVLAYEAALEIDPNLHEAYYYKALALDRAGKSKEALAAYRAFAAVADEAADRKLLDVIAERTRQLEDGVFLPSTPLPRKAGGDKGQGSG